MNMVELQARQGSALVITDHAFRRAKERLHWQHTSLLRMAGRALVVGMAPGDAAGPLKFFLCAKEEASFRSCPFLYGENIYVFCLQSDGVTVALVTVYRAPQGLLRALRTKRPRFRTRDGSSAN